MRKTAGTSLAAILCTVLAALCISDNAFADSLVVSTCGTNPQTYSAGATRLDTVDVNGNKCTSDSGGGYGAHSTWKSGSASATNTNATTIIAAPSANKLYITGAQCFRTDAGTTAIYVTFNDSASTVMGLANSGGGGGNNMVFSTPLVVAATTAFTFTASSGTSTVYCNAQGYNAP